MQRTSAMESAPSVSRRVFPAVLLLCLANSGCNSCYSGFWNGNGSGLAVSTSSCPLTKSAGAVIVRIGVVSAPPAAAAFASPHDVQHIFVTLHGIEAHPSMMAGEDSPGWEELVPDLAAHPMQLDLLAVKGDSRSLGLPASTTAPATIPADEYRQLRLRLVSVHPSTDDVIPESNDCGNVGWNCIVFADRSVLPLEFDSPVAEFHITPERGTDNVFRVLPDDVIHLSIEFNAASSVFFASNTVVHLIPVFSVISRTASSTFSAQ